MTIVEQVNKVIDDAKKLKESLADVSYFDMQQTVDSVALDLVKKIISNHLTS